MRSCGAWGWLLVVCTLVACRGASAPRSVLPFIENDYGRALAEAKRTHRPLFVDVWAEWCVPCMKMKREVFTDPALADLRDHFVWLSVDKENAANAAFLARFPADALPMLWIIDSASDRVLLKMDRGASTASLRPMLTTSEEVLAAGEEDERAVAVRWAAALEIAAAAAPDADSRIAFDAQRLHAYLALGAPERAIPMLEQSARDFPKWFEPHARLATVYIEMKRFDHARSEIYRAALLVHGARALPVLEVAADVARARGDRDAERTALANALEETETVRLSAGDRARRDALRARLDSLK